MVKIIPIAHYLFAIAFSEYYSKADWQNWADERILRQTRPEPWLINVSLASNIDVLSKVLSDQMISERDSVKSMPPFSDAVIGYFYLKYLSKKITLNDLLQKSGEEADGGEGATRACEDYYSILNKLEANKDLDQDSSFIMMIEEIFEPLKFIALSQKEVLEKY